MDAVTISKLIAEIEDQIPEIESCYVRVESRAAELKPESDGTVDALALQLHNFYNAAEDLLKLVAEAFENQIEAASWHRGLVHQLALNIEGVRPALVSKELLPHLDEIRKFRHFVRHSYGKDFDLEKVKRNLEEAHAAMPLLRRDTSVFSDHLRKLRDSLTQQSNPGHS